MTVSFPFITYKYSDKRRVKVRTIKAPNKILHYTTTASSIIVSAICYGLPSPSHQHPCSRSHCNPVCCLLISKPSSPCTFWCINIQVDPTVNWTVSAPQLTLLITSNHLHQITHQLTIKVVSVATNSISKTTFNGGFNRINKSGLFAVSIKTSVKLTEFLSKVRKKNTRDCMMMWYVAPI